MLRVFIALGKSLPKNKAMIEDTEEAARILAKYNCTMVQGGAKIGLMGLAVQEFQKYSNEVVMIVPEVHKSDLEGTISKEQYIVEGESDRMRITIHSCDMMIVLPGGSGTLAELSYYNETAKSGEHNAKVVVINTNGYYNKLFKFHQHQIKSGFMNKDAIKYEVVKSAKDLEPIIQKLIAEKQEELQKAELEEKKTKAKDVEKVEKKKKATRKSTKEDKAETKNVSVEVESEIESVEDVVAVEKIEESKKVTKKPTSKVKNVSKKESTTKKVKSDTEDIKTEKPKAKKTVNKKESNTKGSKPKAKTTTKSKAGSKTTKKKEVK